VLVHHYIGRLEVAADDAGRLGAGEGVGDLDGDFQRLVELHSSARNKLLQRLAGHVIRELSGFIAWDDRVA